VTHLRSRQASVVYGILFGMDNLRGLREQRGLTQAQLARRAGISLRTYLRIESGSGNPRLTTLCGIAEVLGLPVQTVVARLACDPDGRGTPARGRRASGMAEGVQNTRVRRGKGAR